MLGLFTQLPRDVRNILYAINGVIFKLRTLSKSFLRETQRVVDVKKLLMPISGQEALKYILYLCQSEKNSMLSFCVLLPSQEAISWHVHSSEECSVATICAEDRILWMQNGGVERNVTTAAFGRLCNMLDTEEEVLLSYHLAIDILMRRFPLGTRLLSHRIYCTFVRQTIDKVLAEYQLPHQCVFSAILEPSSFVVNRYDKSKLLNTIVHEDANKYKPFMLKLAIIRAVCTNVSPLLERRHHTDPNFNIDVESGRILDIYSGLLSRFHTMLHTPAKPRMLTATNLLSFLREKIATIKLDEQVAYHLRVVAPGIDEYMFFCCKRDHNEVLLFQQVGFVPVDECTVWTNMQLTLIQCKTAIIISPLIAEEMCSLREYSIIVKQQLRLVCTELGISLNDLLGHTKDGSIEAEASVCTKLEQHLLQHHEQIGSMRLLCTYLFALEGFRAPVANDNIQILALQISQYGRKLGIYTFMQ